MYYYNIKGNIEQFETDLFNINGLVFLNLTEEQIAYMESSQSTSYEDVIRLGIYPQHVVTAEELINQIYSTYEKAETSNLTPAGAIQLAEWCGSGNVKALAVRQWLIDLYDERDSKLTLIEGGDLTVDTNPSQPNKPYSFREMKLNI